MLKKQKWLFPMAILFCALLFSGCGNKADGAAAAEAGASQSHTAAYATEEAVAEEEYIETEEAAEGFAGGLLQAPAQTNDKLVYSGSVTLQTLEYDETLSNTHKKIEAAGGFIQWEDESDGNYDWYNSSVRNTTRNAQIQARVPSDAFHSFMEGVEEDGQVMNRHVNVDNITQTYNETEATVKAYEIERDRLLAMMDKAETIEDMIAVEARLSEVEGELSRYKTSLSSMDTDVKYSTVTITIEEVRKYTEQHDDSTFVSRLKETGKASWRGFLLFLEGLLHLVIRLIPFLILAALIFLLVWTLNKRFAGKRQARKERRMQKKMQKMQEAQQKMMRVQGPLNTTEDRGKNDEQRTGKDV